MQDAQPSVVSFLDKYVQAQAVGAVFDRLLDPVSA